MSITDSTPQVTDIAGAMAAMKRRWWLIALVGVLGAAAAAGYATRQATAYTAYSTVLVNPLGLEPTQALSSGSVDLEVEEELAASYVVAADAVTRLDGVAVNYVDDDDPVRGLRRAMVITGRGERVLELSFSHADPQVARSVTEAYTAAYLDSRLELLTASKAEALAALDARQAQLQLQLDEVNSQLETLESERDRATAAAVENELPPPSIDSQETAARFEQTQLLSRLADVEEERADLESLSSRSGELIGPPQLPSAPTTPADIQVIIAGGVLGLLLGAALVWLLHRSAARLGSPEELLRRAGVPVVGSVQRPASISSAAHQGAGADYAFLATTVLAQAEALGQTPPLVIAATSVSNGDAAATTALSIGRSLAAGRRVLVVSADLENDELGLALGLDGHPGVAAYLQGLTIATHPIGHNLEVLPAGRTADAVNLVRSPLLPQLFIELQNRYDVILVTTPGLGTRPEAAAVTWLAGSVLLCLDPARDTRDRFARAVTLLDELGTPVLGAATVDGGRRGGPTGGRATAPATPLPSQASQAATPQGPVSPGTWPAASSSTPASSSAGPNP